MKKIPQEKIDQCRNLRIKERLSLRELEHKTGLSRGMVSVLVRDLPLTPGEIKSRRNTQHLIRKSQGPKRKYIGLKSKFCLMAEQSMLSPMQKANASEAAVLFRLCLHGFTVFGSPFDGDRVDWIVRAPQSGRVYKIQVKCVIHGKSGMPLINLRMNHSRSRYLESDFDFIVGYDLTEDVAYVYSFAETAENSATISVDHSALEKWSKLKK